MAQKIYDHFHPPAGADAPAADAPTESAAGEPPPALRS
jgi:hypothetical protein